MTHLFWIIPTLVVCLLVVLMEKIKGEHDVLLKKYVHMQQKYKLQQEAVLKVESMLCANTKWPNMPIHKTAFSVSRDDLKMMITTLKGTRS